MAQILAKRLSQEELEQELDSICLEATKGRSITSWSVGDSSAERQVWLNNPPGSRASMLIEALVIVNPTEYPPDIFLPIQQTKPVFT